MARGWLCNSASPAATATASAEEGDVDVARAQGVVGEPPYVCAGVEGGQHESVRGLRTVDGAQRGDRGDTVLELADDQVKSGLVDGERRVGVGGEERGGSREERGGSREERGESRAGEQQRQEQRRRSGFAHRFTPITRAYRVQPPLSSKKNPLMGVICASMGKEAMRASTASRLRRWRTQSPRNSIFSALPPS